MSRAALPDQKKMIAGLASHNLPTGLSAWIGDQLRLGAEVRDVEIALELAIRQIKRAEAYCNEISRTEAA